MSWFLWAAFISLCLAHNSPLAIKSPEVYRQSELVAATKKVPILEGRASVDVDDDKPPLLANATISELERARAIVNAAIQQVAVHNKARLDNPTRNKYTLNPNTKISKREDGPPLFNVTDEIAAAAALVAEADAYADLKNGTLRRGIDKRAGTYWMGSIARMGSWPFGGDSTYVVFRDVTKYGAVGDGVHDDTAAINKAVTDGKRCGEKCNGSTTKGAIIYFPPGTYLISGTIETLFGTQFIGDAVNVPTLKASSSFVGLGVISTDHYVEGGGTGSDGNAKEWFINTANFYRQIRNFKIDITATNQGAYVCALHYQVAQATSLQNIEFISSTVAGTTQQAIYAENGSGGFMSDLTFIGGAFGIYGGSQQFTAQRLNFKGCRTAIQLIWDWGWTWKSIKIDGSIIGISLVSEDGVHHTGSIMVVDSTFTNTKTAILSFPPTRNTGDGTTGITLDNVQFTGVTDAVADNTGTVYLAGSVGSVDTWALGPVYFAGAERLYALGTTFATTRQPTLLGKANGLPKQPYFERSKPQYVTSAPDDFVHMKSYAKGDGVTDDTASFQGVFDKFGSSKIYFIDAGSYILKDTITIPSGARIVGENWAQLIAFGAKFQDESKPLPLIKVGNKGDRGQVEMQDLIFTSKGPTAGVVFVEWNIKSTQLGGAGMWDCHVRVGGATGTDLTSSQCPALKTGTPPNCNAGSALMHITSSGSAYLENVWLWVADHDIDDPDLVDDNNNMIQCSIFVARGLLIESTTATWLYGTSSEHAVLYQYQFYNAENIMAGMIQTESPYYQPTPLPPAPFTSTVGVFPGDPCGAGESCDASWAVRMIQSKNIIIHGAGLYSWFQTYSQDCVDTADCQKSLIQLKDNHGGIRFHNLITIGATNMIDSNGGFIKAADNLGVDYHPYWSQVTVYDPIQVATSCENTAPVDPPTPEGSFIDYYDGIDSASSFTIVNGSPYDFVLVYNNSYQMRNWEWSTIPAGQSAQFNIWFKTGVSIHEKDSAGEVTYKLDGTDKTFQVLASYNESTFPNYHLKIFYENLQTVDVSKGETLDLGFPLTVAGINPTLQWVLTGSESYGYWSSSKPLVTWMQSIIDIIGERKLKYVCMPGSHDAGMSKIDGNTPLSNPGNTQTQLLNIHDQLVRGSRYLDIRPCLGNGGKTMTGHYSKISSYQGANGESIQDVIAEVNQFMTEYPGELVILDINNEAGFNTDDGYERLTSEQWANIIALFANGIEKPCAGFGGRYLPDVTMNEYIGDGKGCVISIMRNLGNPANPDKGMYVYGDSTWTVVNQYAESDEHQYMAEDQIAKMKSNRLLTNDGTARDEFFVLSWTLTLGAASLGLWNIKTFAAQCFGSLFWYAYQEMTPLTYPNVLYVDYLGAPSSTIKTGDNDRTNLEKTNNDITALAMAINLHIASQNCNVGSAEILLE